MSDAFAAPVEQPGRGERAAVTVAVLAVLFAARMVPMSGIDHALLAEYAEQAVVPDAAFGVLALGITPWVSAFILVELVALVLPPLRHLRAAPGRDVLTRASLRLGVGVAFVQGLALAIGLESMRVGPDDLVFAPGLTFRVTLALTVVAGAVIALLGARAIDRHGLGNGFAVILGAQVFEQAVLGLANARVAVQLGEIAPVEVVAVVGFAVASIAVTRWMFVRYEPAGVLRLPLAGAVGVGHAVAVVTPFGLSAFGLAASVVVFTFVWARLFHPPDAVAAATGRTADDVRKAFPAALPYALGYGLLGVATTWPIAGEMALPPGLGFVALASLTAIAMDLHEEWVGRGELGDVVPIWPTAQPYAVDGALAKLDAAGIPARARGVRYRLLLHFFAPYAPIELLVPSARADEAVAVLSA